MQINTCSSVILSLQVCLCVLRTVLPRLAEQAHCVICDKQHIAGKAEKSRVGGEMPNHGGKAQELEKLHLKMCEGKLTLKTELDVSNAKSSVLDSFLKTSSQVGFSDTEMNRVDE